MRACFCSLAGTRHCDTCSNGPSRLAFDINPRLRDINPQIKTVSLTDFDLDIPEPDSIKETMASLEEEFDPVKEIMAVLKKFDYHAKKER